MIKTTTLSIALFFAASATAQVEIYNEDFQSGLPATYTIVDNDGLTPDASVSEFAPAWIALVDPGDGNDTIMGSTSFFDPAGQADRWLITDAIVLGAYGNVAYWEAKSQDASYPDDYYVLISTTNTQLSSFTDTLEYVTNEFPEWTSHEGNMSDLGINSQTIYLAFVNRTNDGFKLYIDDIRVEIEDPVGINEQEIANISVYPNPSSGIVHISGLEDVNLIQIVSIDGQLLLESSVNSIDLSTLASGRYLLVASNETRSARAFVVKR